ncbi:MAG: hypothetical protein JO233_01925 [Candidatus Eremiobacteraeota bacterium]|nr:hypothetical protein [Candidatus Eremiobacteraeota bacterium]
MLLLFSASLQLANAQSAPSQNETAAKTFYAQLVLGKVDRSKLSTEVNNAITDPLLGTFSKQLSEAGTPTWQYVKEMKTPWGPSSIYKLTYPKTVLYFYFGVSSAGTIYNVYFGNQPPPNS